MEVPESRVVSDELIKICFGYTINGDIFDALYKGDSWALLFSI